MVRLPMLKDRHSHPLLYAGLEHGVQLIDVRDKQESLELLHSAANENTQEILTGHGWRDNHFDLSAADLDALPPAAVLNVSLHQLRINAAGLEVLEKRFGPEVRNIRNQDWYERNFRKVLNFFACLGASADRLIHFFDSLLDQGVGYAEEMLLVNARELELFRQADLLDRTSFWASPETFLELPAADRQLVSGIKLFTDGALGSRTAALTRPYVTTNVADGADNCGMLLNDDQAFLATVERSLRLSPSLAIHAIGDRAIQQIVETVSRLSAELRTTAEVRIEHAQMISKEMAEQAKALGIRLCMQPNFSLDSTDYDDRLDDAYCRMNNPFRMLIDEVGYIVGDDLIFGSDGMPHGARAAISAALRPPLANQQLTLDEFQRGYCCDDDRLGAIEIDEQLNVRVVRN